MSVRISGSKWKGLLDKFSDKVKDGKYSKIPYKDWKVIYTDKFLIEVRLDLNYEVKITFVNFNASLDSYSHFVEDKDFYDFISRELFISDKTLANCCDEAFKVVGTAAEITADSINSIGNVYASMANTVLNNTNTLKTDSVSNCSASAISNLISSYYDNKTDFDATKTATKSYSTNTIGLNIPSISSFDYYKYQGVWDSVTAKGDLEERFDKLEAELLKKEDKKENENTMKFNIDFGPVKDIVHMSMYGMAIKNKNGNYVSYDPATESIIDVDILNFEGANKFMYKMPVPVKDIKIGDIIVHNGIPCFVRYVPSDDIKTFAVIDPYESEIKEIVIPKSMFGFDYATKVVNLLEGAFGATPASAENPFGNMLPLMLLSDGAKSEDMLPLMLMNASGTDIFSNPMMMYMVMKDRKDFDPMMMMLMMNQPQHTCHCKDKK